MTKRLHIITGASRGLGRALAQELAARNDDVVTIARTKGDAIPNVHFYACDFGSVFSATDLLRDILAKHPPERYSQVTLVNNAGVVEPIAPSSKLNETDVLKNILVNFHAPVCLTSAFLAQTRTAASRHVVNVSSGVAQRPKAYWAVYSAAKAGLEAFTEAASQEPQDGAPCRFTIFGPGIIDTEMQATIRSTSAENFPERERFVSFKRDGQLLTPEFVAQKIVKILDGATDAKLRLNVGEIS